MSTKVQLLKFASLLESLEASVDEYETLKAISQEPPTLESNQELSLLVSKAYNLARAIELELLDDPAGAVNKDRYAEFEDDLNEYDALLDRIGRSEVSRYAFDRSRLDEAYKPKAPEPAVAGRANGNGSTSGYHDSDDSEEDENDDDDAIVMRPPSPKKSVRFKDNVVDSFSDGITTTTTDANGTSSGGGGGGGFAQMQPFEPYKDEPSSETSSVNSLGMSNRQVFITNQQEILNQDQMLDHLSNSVNRQHQMSLDINGEVNDHLMLLDDLESGIHRTSARIMRGRNNIRKFQEAMRERKDWATILVLITILMFLLIVVK